MKCIRCNKNKAEFCAECYNDVIDALGKEVIQQKKKDDTKAVMP